MALSSAAVSHGTLVWCAWPATAADAGHAASAMTPAEAAAPASARRIEWRIRFPRGSRADWFPCCGRCPPRLRIDRSRGTRSRTAIKIALRVIDIWALHMAPGSLQQITGRADECRVDEDRYCPR